STALEPSSTASLSTAYCWRSRKLVSCRSGWRTFPRCRKRSGRCAGTAAISTAAASRSPTLGDWTRRSSSPRTPRHSRMPERPRAGTGCERPPESFAPGAMPTATLWSRADGPKSCSTPSFPSGTPPPYASSSRRPVASSPTGRAGPATEAAAAWPRTPHWPRRFASSCGDETRDATVHHSDDHRAAFLGFQGSPESLDDLLSPPVLRTEVDEEHLVLPMMNHRGKLHLQTDPFPVVEHAPEHGKLQVLAAPAHDLEYPSQPIRIADVVGDQVDGPHWSPRQERGVLGNLAEQEPSEEPRLDLQHAPVADAVVEDSVGDELVHPPLVRLDQLLPRCGFDGHAEAGADEIVGADDPAVDDLEHDRIGDERTKLLHQIERQ